MTYIINSTKLNNKTRLQYKVDYLFNDLKRFSIEYKRDIEGNINRF